MNQIDYEKAELRKCADDLLAAGDIDVAVLDMRTIGQDTISLSYLSYCDKLAAIANDHKADLFLPDHSLRELFQLYQKLLVTPQQLFLSRYEDTLLERLYNSGIRAYRSISFYAPAFLDFALRNADTPAAVLVNIAKLHSYPEIAKFRALCRHLRNCNPLEADRLHKEIDSLLQDLALRDAFIPEPGIGIGKAAYCFIRILAALVAKKPGQVMDKGKEFWEWLDDRKHSEDIYSAMAFMNRVHRRTLQARNLEAFYQELRRIFGTLSFSLAELQAAYGPPASGGSKQP